MLLLCLLFYVCKCKNPNGYVKNFRAELLMSSRIVENDEIELPADLFERFLL